MSQFLACFINQCRCPGRGLGLSRVGSAGALRSRVGGLHRRRLFLRRGWRQQCAAEDARGYRLWCHVGWITLLVIDKVPVPSLGTIWPALVARFLRLLLGYRGVRRTAFCRAGERLWLCHGCCLHAVGRQTCVRNGNECCQSSRPRHSLGDRRRNPRLPHGSIGQRAQNEIEHESHMSAPPFRGDAGDFKNDTRARRSGRARGQPRRQRWSQKNRPPGTSVARHRRRRQSET